MADLLTPASAFLKVAEQSAEEGSLVWCIAPDAAKLLRARERASGNGGFVLQDGTIAGYPVIVTGATGGVGSVAIALLSRLGHRVTAASGKPQEADYLKALGAAAVIDRAELAAAGKPLQKERWAGVVDALGSHTLANALAQTRYGGVVAACGLAQGMDLPASVAPFILRGVTLAGVDSVMAPRVRRQAAWDRLARDLDPALLERMTSEVPLAEAPAVAERLISGQMRGRCVVRIA